MASKLKKVAFALLPAVVLVGGAEGVARVMGPPPNHLSKHVGESAPDFFVTDAVIGWSLKPGYLLEDPDYMRWAKRTGLPEEDPGLIPISPRGFRDTPLDEPKPAGQKRVYCMGDSSVFGSGVPRQETFAERLEDGLNRARGADPEVTPRAVEVINGGVSGYSSYQALHRLETNLDMQPDVVVAYLMNSDLMAHRGAPDSVYFGRSRAPSAVTLRRAMMLPRWLLWWRDYYFPVRSTTDGMMIRVRAADFYANLQHLADLGIAHDFDVVLVTPTTTSDLQDRIEPIAVTDEEGARAVRAAMDAASDADGWAPHTRELFRRITALVAYERELPLVRAEQVLRTAYDADPDRYVGSEALFVDSIHPSSTGHGLIAEAVQPIVEGMLEE